MTKNNFTVICSPEDKATAESVISSLEGNGGSIAGFFGFNSTEVDQTVIIYPTLEDYRAFLMNTFNFYSGYSVGTAYNGVVHTTTLSQCRRADGHQYMSESDYMKIILHEYVHTCHSSVNNDLYKLNWFAEGLAQKLSGQPVYDVKITCTLEELTGNFQSLENGYAISLKIVNYMFDNYSYAQIMDFIKNPDKLRAETEKILNGAKGV